MDIEAFLNSDLAGRRSRLFAHDAPIRQLRARHASCQAIANYLDLQGVKVTRQAVRDYLLRYPDAIESTSNEMPVQPRQVAEDGRRLANGDDGRTRTQERLTPGTPIPTTDEEGKGDLPARERSPKDAESNTPFAPCRAGDASYHAGEGHREAEHQRHSATPSPDPADSIVERYDETDPANQASVRAYIERVNREIRGARSNNDPNRSSDES